MFQLFKKILENIIVFMGKMTCYSSCCSNINVKVVEKEPKPEKPKFRLLSADFKWARSVTQ